MSLYASQAPSPLAERMRPKALGEFMGQEELLGEGKPFRRMLESGKIHSMILWGPPGVGKTTLARLMASLADVQFVSLSAVTSGLKEVRELMAEARELRAKAGRRTLLFIDEIHRFNKVQQDAFLPHVESGDIVLVGATTENPSFEVVSPLLSRCKVYVLKPLSREDIRAIVRRALSSDEFLRSRGAPLSEDGEEFLLTYANGDARTALNLLEASTETLPEGEAQISVERLREAAQSKMMLYDKAGEEHFNLISAFHKSLRNSDPDAALYWLARMLEGGEDPLYIVRRMVCVAAEDIGLADPRALTVALDAKEAVDFIGMPEGHLALSEATVYLALAPKSNSAYVAYGEAASDVRTKECGSVPLHLRNPVTGLMKGIGYGKDYRYAHDEPEGVAPMECLPENLRGREYYRPTERGLESRLRERLAEIKKIQRKGKPDGK
ncbi:MAG: replication-associated recombination protein A [Acidobacteriota bacterium]|nr:MAG: replication-associated recombination protein A [Acidobacteriota bacterium]